MRRELDAIERQLLNFPVSHTVRYAGDLDVPALRTAFGRAAARNPVLACRIRHSADGAHVERRPDGPSLTVVHDQDPSATDALGPDWDVGRAAVQLRVVLADGHGAVTLRADHSVADFTCLYALFGEIWRCYAEVIAGDDGTVQRASPFPYPPSDLLWRCLPGEERVRPRNTDRIDSGRPAHPVSHARVRVSAEDTRRLIAHAGREATSLLGLLTAAVLSTQWALRPAGAEPSPMAYAIVVDLRARAEPPIEATETTNLAGEHRDRISIGPHSDLAAVAREVKRSLDQGISAGTPARDLLGRTAGELNETQELDLGFATVSNVGRLAEPGLPASLRQTDFEVVAHHLLKSHPAYICYTHAGALNVTALLRSDVGTGLLPRIADGLRKRLHALARTGTP
jgi:hypothetical protein